MNRQIQVTEDGSHTIALEDTGITYHSTHGAIQESLHVFINAGLKPLLYKQKTVHVFEMGFGTGLNALLSLQAALEFGDCVNYIAAEQFPLVTEEFELLNYCEVLKKKDLQPYFTLMHAAHWGEDVYITPGFILHKIKQSVVNLTLPQQFDIIFFDAFAPADQPELWTKDIFEKMYNMLENGGVLVSYCSKGNVRRTLKAVGFNVEKLQGPPGKREITRATKP